MTFKEWKKKKELETMIKRKSLNFSVGLGVFFSFILGVYTWN